MSSPSLAAIPASERAVLDAIYAQTNGAGWTNNAGWEGAAGTECSWYGITCDASGTHVTAIEVAGNNLSGTLPPLDALGSVDTLYFYNNQLTGSIPALTGLLGLQYFYASNNRLSGPLPAFAGLSSLRVFTANANQLTGPLPDLTNLNNLIFFDVDQNQLTGSIPPLTTLNNLTFFNVSYNLLSGPIPDLPNAGNFYYFGARANLLTGSIPSLSGFTALHTFDVGNNQLSGAIPDLAGLGNLGEFDVNNNQLTGPIPSLAGLNNLGSLNVSYNKLSGEAPPPPPALAVGASALCPNLLTHSASVTWDAATGANPWYTGCTQPTTTTLTSSPATSVFGQAVEFDADITSDSSSGSASFRDGSNVLCSTSLNSSGSVQTASCVTSTMATGAHGITAAFSGNSGNAASTSSVLTQAVNKASTALTLSATPNSVPVGSSVTVTFALTVVAPGAGMPTGTVNVSDGSSGCNLKLPATSCTFSAIGAGMKTLTATYSGDSNFAASSDSAGLNVNIAKSTTTLTSTTNPSTFGRNVSFSASVSGYAPSGTVSFNDGAVVLCGANLGGTGDRRTASCSSATLAAGSHSITATYFGDSNNTLSVSAPLIQVVNDIPPPLNLDQHGLTGTWYNPATSGQGLLVETYPDLKGSGHGYLAAGWYTFDLTAGGGQRWYTVQGDAISGGASVPLIIYTATDGNFSAPPKISAVQVGTATLSFSDCTHGTLAYHFNDGRPDGSIPLTRLDTNVTCTPSGDNGNATANYLLSGAWYDATHTTSGQGFFFDFSPALTTLFGAWYTYSPDGASIGGGASQRWYTIQDNAFTPGTTTKNGLPIYETTGGTFNTAGGASAGSPVGTANIVISSCSSMMLTYTFSSGTNAGQSGTIDLTRVVSTPAGCSL